MSLKACPSQPTFRPLSKDEIDRRIDTLAQQLAVTPDEEREDAAASCEPRWISAAELVRRVRPFIVMN